MKKISLTLLSVLLLSSAAMADDVLFKMVSTPAVSNTNVDAGATLDLASNNFFFYTEGSAEVYAKADGEPQEVLKNHCVRIVNSSTAYVKVTLKAGETLQPGDVIELRGYESVTDDEYFYIYNEGGTAGRKATHKLMKENNLATYTIKENDVLSGLGYFYINQGAKTTYITAVTVSRPTELVKFYSFDAMTPTNFETTTTTGNVIVAGELYLNSDGITGNGANGIKAASGAKPQALYSRGANENRAIMLNVTDPCTVEIWAFSSQKDLSISEGTYASGSATKIITGNAVENNVIQKGTYNYTGLEDTKTLYTIPTGGIYVAAIRVTYAKIRPAADLAASATDIYMRVGDRKSVQLTTSSNVAVVRTRPDSGTGSIGNLNVEDATHTYTFTANALGEYVMRLSQAASADYRAATVDVNIHIQESVESHSTIDKTASPDNTSVLTLGNITLIGEDAEAKIDNGNDTYVLNSIKVIRDKSYTISVPTNCVIKSAKFTGMTNSSVGSDNGNQGYVTINGVNSSLFQFVKINDVQQDPVEYTFSDIDASSVTFKVANKGTLILTIDLTIEETSSYPVTVANGWATFYNHDDFVQMPAGMKAYYAHPDSNYYQGSVIRLQEVEGQIIRPDRAVVLTGTDGADALQIISNPGSGNYDNFNSALSGTYKRTARPSGTIYCLNGAEGAFQQYNGAYIPANKAYYRYTGANNAPARIGIRIVQHENTTTAIDNTEAFIGIDYSAPIYNLQGQQVQVTESGIYIQNGRKYLIMK